MWMVTAYPLIGWHLGGIRMVLWVAQFVWIAHGHSINSTVEMRAILTATNSFSLSTIPTEGTRKPSRKNRVEYKLARPKLIEDQILDWVADISPVVEMPLTLHFG